MPGFHVSFNFSQQVSRSGGWWEDYWNNATDLGTVLTEAAALVPLLQAIHGEDTDLNAYRASMVPISGDSFSPTSPFVPLSQLVNLVIGPPPSSLGNDFSDYPTTALELQVASTGTPQRVTRQWIRGISDAITDNGGFLTPGGSARYSGGIGPFLTALCATGTHWSVHVRDLTPVKQTIQNFDLSNGTYTMAAAHGFTVGQQVQVYKVGINCCGRNGLTKKVPLDAANGLKTVASVTTTTWTATQPWTAPVAPLPVVNCAGARAGAVSFVMPHLDAQVPSTNRFSGAQIVRVTKKNVGRPSLVLTGRRKTRR